MPTCTTRQLDAHLELLRNVGRVILRAVIEPQQCLPAGLVSKTGAATAEQRSFLLSYIVAKGDVCAVDKAAIGTYGSPDIFHAEAEAREALRVLEDHSSELARPLLEMMEADEADFEEYGTLDDVFCNGSTLAVRTAPERAKCVCFLVHDMLIATRRAQLDAIVRPQPRNDIVWLAS